MITLILSLSKDATLLMQHCSCLEVCGSTLQSCRQSDVARGAWS